MNFKCHKCEKPISENYYCFEYASFLKQYQQKPKQKTKINEAKLIHKAMFG